MSTVIVPLSSKEMMETRLNYAELPSSMHIQFYLYTNQRAVRRHESEVLSASLNKL
jgi:hypothetical protein